MYLVGSVIHHEDCSSTHALRPADNTSAAACACHTSSICCVQKISIPKRDIHTYIHTYIHTILYLVALLILPIVDVVIKSFSHVCTCTPCRGLTHSRQSNRCDIYYGHYAPFITSLARYVLSSYSSGTINLVPRPQKEKKQPGTNCTCMRQHFREIHCKIVCIMRMKHMVMPQK